MRENEPFPLPAELVDLENELARWAPQPLALDRDALMFRAGYSAAEKELSRHAPSSSVRPSKQFIWPTLAGAMSLASLFLLYLQFTRPGPTAPSNSGANRASALAIKEPSPAQQFVTPLGTNRSPQFYANGSLGTGRGWLIGGYRSPLAMRQLIAGGSLEAMQFSEPAADSHDFVENRQPATVQQLLKELLPTSERRASPPVGNPIPSNDNSGGIYMPKETVI